MPPVGFEPTIPARARPQTYALNRAATGIGRTKAAGHKTAHSFQFSAAVKNVWKFKDVSIYVSIGVAHY
jgi:hypothetical protein